MIKYRLATEKDNAQLIKLTASAGMGGEIALRIDRNPNFFNLLKLRGETRVYVAEEDKKIIGSLCVSMQDVYINKVLTPVNYIGDFKVDPEHRNRGIGMNLTNTVASYLISIDADLVFLNVSKGNNKPFSFFKDRTVGTDFESIGCFNIYQFVGKKKKSKHADYTIELSEASEETIFFLNNAYKNYELGSQITKEKLADTQLFTIKQNGSIIAAMCIIDTMHLKQNIVTRVSWKMNVLLKLTNMFSPMMGISKMPVLEQPVKMVYIKYLAIQKDEEQVIKLLLNHAKNIVYDKSYSFVSFGIHERDPLNAYFKRMRKFTFHSVGMLSSLHESVDKVKAIKEGVPFEDYSIV